MTKVTIRVMTAPEEFHAPENYDGAVTRAGHERPLLLKAKDWRPGDVVQCLMRLDGQLTPVRFTIHQLTRLEET